ncbi:MAG: 4Fe-4S binding protein [bacterium]
MIRLICSILFLLSTLSADADNRFPKPQFESGYTAPIPTAPAARSPAIETLDVAVLLGALSLAAWLVLKKRSRRGVFLLTLFSLLYFGFFRKGCVCPVGSLQNMTLWLFDSHTALSLSIAAFFLLPLIFALLFGRVFCAAVCPLGTIQDLVIVSPKKVHPVLAQILGFIPYLYLGLAVLMAATGTAYVICRLDPFVAFFRFGGEFPMIVTGIVFLLIGTVIARPYCRFLCPYGVLLNWMSRLSKYHATVTPNECVKCRLCEPACPFDAIEFPQPNPTPETRNTGLRRLALMLVLLPVLIGVGGWSVSRLAPALARQNPKVKLAESLRLPPSPASTTPSLEITAFNGSGAKREDLERQAAIITAEFGIGSWILGGFLGAVLGCTLIGASIKRRQEIYEPDKGTCLSCARCYLACPQEHQRLGLIIPNAKP